MSIKKKNYLLQIAERVNDGNSSKSEEMLLNNFMEHKYEESTWDSNLMGDKDLIRSSISSKIIKARYKSRVFPYAIAASLGLLVCLSLLLHRKQSIPSMQKFATAAGTDSVMLNDGSIVFLAAHSEMEYPERFAGDSREIRLLKGDAFFKIAKDPQHPFIISSGTIKTKVLGTSFHIAFNKNSYTIAVATGKVNVSAEGRSIDLLPNEGACYQNNLLVKQVGNTELLANWFSKDLHLEQVPLSEVLTAIRLRYGVNFEVSKKSILNNRITLYMENGAALQSILNQINYITDLKFDAYDKTVKISK